VGLCQGAGGDWWICVREREVTGGCA